MSSKSKNKSSKKSKKNESNSSDNVVRIECREMINALSSIRSAVGTDTTSVSVVSKGSECLVMATSAALTLSIRVNGCEGTGQFTVDIESFRQILSSRKSLDCRASSGKLKFESGKYRGTLVLLPYNEIKFDNQDKDVLLTIPRDSGLASSLNLARKNLALTNVQPEIPSVLNISVRDGKMVCAVADRFHMGMYTGKVSTKETLSFNMQDSILRKVLALTKTEAEYDMYVESSRIIVKADNVQAIMVMTQSKMDSFDMFLKVINKKIDDVQTKMIVSSDIMDTIISNMMGIFESHKTIKLSISKEGGDLAYSTSFGEVKENLEVETKGSKAYVNLSPELIKDVVDNLPDGEIEVGISIEKKDSSNKTLILRSVEKGFVYVVSNTV